MFQTNRLGREKASNVHEKSWASFKLEETPTQRNGNDAETFPEDGEPLDEMLALPIDPSKEMLHSSNYLLPLGRPCTCIY